MKKLLCVVLMISLCTLSLALFSCTEEQPPREAEYPFGDLSEENLTSVTVYKVLHEQELTADEVAELLPMLRALPTYERVTRETETEIQRNGPYMFTLHFADGTSYPVIFEYPHVLIDHTVYATDREPCDALEGFYNELSAKYFTLPERPFENLTAADIVSVKGMEYGESPNYVLSEEQQAELITLLQGVTVGTETGRIYDYVGDGYLFCLEMQNGKRVLIGRRGDRFNINGVYYQSDGAAMQALNDLYSEVKAANEAT